MPGKGTRAVPQPSQESPLFRCSEVVALSDYLSCNSLNSNLADGVSKAPFVGQTGSRFGDFERNRDVTPIDSPYLVGACHLSYSANPCR